MLFFRDYASTFTIVCCILGDYTSKFTLKCCFLGTTPVHTPFLLFLGDFIIKFILKCCFLGDYTSKFTQLPGQTVLSSSSVIYQQVFDTNQCAKLCDNYQAFNCKSFDFCFDIGTCFLGKSHVFDVPKGDIISNPMCNHFSRKYFDSCSPLLEKYFVCLLF